MSKRGRDIEVLVVFSDLHSGSRRSLMPPRYQLYEEGTGRNSGQTILANPQQRWLWKCWQDGWAKVRKYIGNDPWAWACVGDAIQGIRHKEELISVDPTDHMIIFDQCVRPQIKGASKGFFVRGTQAHTMETVEMKLAEKLGCEKHPDTGQWAADRWLLEINGFKLLMRHHMSVTQREYLRTAALGVEFGNEVIAAKMHRQPSPDGCVFAHRHAFDWWNGGHNCVLVCGPWQQTTRYGHTRWSAMIPEPTITVLDWRGLPPGSVPKAETFQYTPKPQAVYKL